MRRLAWAWLFVLVLTGGPAFAQGSSKQEPPAPTPAATADPLGRDTPRGTIIGFTGAVHHNDLLAARAYLQLTERQRRDADTLARTLTTLLDRHFKSPITTLSASNTGDPADGLPPDQDALVLAMPDGETTILLRRVKDKQAGDIWLVSSESLSRVPSLGRAVEASWIDRHVPLALTEHSLFGLPLSSLVIWVGSLAVPLLGIWIVSTLLIAIVRWSLRSPARRKKFDAYVTDLRWVTIFLLTLGVHVALVPMLGLSVPARLRDVRVSLVAGVVLATMLGIRFMAVLFDQARLVAANRGRAGTQSLMLLIERVAKVLIVLVAILVMLRLFGVNTTTALAGVGIGGVALALGAQKSVENLIGAVSLLTDKAIAIGDFCSIGDRLGRIEDITLRSVRLRTTEQTLVSIPASTLSAASIENFTTRRKILVQTILRLRYGTTVMQLHAIIDQIHDLVVRNPDLDAEQSRVRLVNFGPQAIEVELFTYVKTADIGDFMAVRENLLLAAAAVIESAGAAFAGAPFVPPPAPAPAPSAPARS